MLLRARQLWNEATILCITHDIQDTSDFERVVVVAEGRIVEDGSPGALQREPRSRYRALLEAEKSVRQGLWSTSTWRRLRLEAGRFVHAVEGDET